MANIENHQATNAVVTLFATWAFGIAPPNMKVLGNVGIIVLGVVIASFGEIKFDLVGFVCACGPISSVRARSRPPKMLTNMSQTNAAVSFLRPSA